eukprot:4432041-Heterocapsa_arctica.AAC.1
MPASPTSTSATPISSVPSCHRLDGRPRGSPAGTSVGKAHLRLRVQMGASSCLPQAPFARGSG